MTVFVMTRLSPNAESNSDIFGLLGVCTSNVSGPTAKSSTKSGQVKPGMDVNVADIIKSNEIIRNSGKPNAFLC